MDNTHDNQRRSSGVTMATIAMIIALAALTLAWLAYNRSGTDLEDNVNDTLNSASENVGENAQQGLDSVERGVDNGPDGVDDGSR